MIQFFKIIILCLILLFINGCTSVRVPNLDFFDNKKEDLGKYPKLSDLPNLPENLRPAKKWDTQVKKIINDRKIVNNNIKEIKEEQTATDNILDEIVILKSLVSSYKSDDPSDSTTNNE
jgi:hypothetical protein